MSRLVVLAGPTAVGKGTLVHRLRERNPEVWFSISATTRPPRPGEQDGVHYHFVTDEQFSQMIEADELLEWAVVHGKHRYGTPGGPVDEQLAAGVPALLEVDLQGARQVRKTRPDALFVFIEPPSMEELVRRLETRGTESEEERAVRLETARTEMAAASEFDVRIVNDEIERAVTELERVVLKGEA